MPFCIYTLKKYDIHHVIVLLLLNTVFDSNFFIIVTNKTLPAGRVYLTPVKNIVFQGFSLLYNH